MIDIIEKTIIKKIDNILIKLIDENFKSLDFGTSLDFGDSLFDFREHKISNLKKSQDDIYSRVGYYARYTKPFTILFKGSFIHILTEEEELQHELEAREAEEAFLQTRSLLHRTRLLQTRCLPLR